MVEAQVTHHYPGCTWGDGTPCRPQCRCECHEQFMGVKRLLARREHDARQAARGRRHRYLGERRLSVVAPCRYCGQGYREGDHHRGNDA